MRGALRRTVSGPLLPALAGVAVAVCCLPLLSRPLWYDEAWRAWHIARGPLQWGALADAGAPSAAGWLGLEELAGAVLGLHEWALRLPSYAAVVAVGPATWWLGRRWLTPAANTAAAVLVTLNGSLLVYGMQLKPYLLEAVATPLLVGTWLVAQEVRTTGRQAWAAYAGMAGLTLLSLPGVFVLGPLLALDALRHRRSHGRGHLLLLAAPAMAGGVAVAHLLLVVRHQSALLGQGFWRFDALRTPWQGVARLAAYARDLPSAGLTEPDGNPTSPFLGSRLLELPPVAVVAVAAVGVAALWLAGARRAASLGGAAATTAAVTAGAVALVLLAGALRLWPIGPVRVNLFLVPLLALLAATGAARAPRGALVLALLVAGLGAREALLLRASGHEDLLLGAVKAQVAAERAVAVPGDLAVILLGRPDVAQWAKGQRFYADDFPWHTVGYAVPAAATLLAPTWRPGLLAGWLPGRGAPQHVLLSAYNRVTDAETAAAVDELGALGWCPRSTRSDRLTGSLTVLARCPGRS